ncbi:hypothetical protein ACIF8T_13430 [Streptomyces sp. NPDC085946]|uniref:hypothetical protein n=1 Tax=Streptomyces sp. NPDC085946 TaxID=3365744 RepID=UPI0037D02803
MPEHDSILRLTGVVLLALAAGVWSVGLVRVLRRGRAETSWPVPRPLTALPPQRRTGPALEAVELTPAERSAFASLVQRLDEGPRSDGPGREGPARG